MNDFILTIHLLFQHVWLSRDRKVDGWFLCDSFIPVFIAQIVYVIFVLKIGPILMENRKPFNLRIQFVLFNVLAATANLVLNYEFWMSGWGTDYKVFCEQQDLSINERTVKMARACWWFYMLRYMDCIYTVFCVFLKKLHKITLQHVFHHATMLLTGYIVVRYFPGGYVTFGCLINTMSHVAMYLYYAFANLNPGSIFRSKLSKVVFWINLMELNVIFLYFLITTFKCMFSVVTVLYVFVFMFLYIILLIRAMWCSDKTDLEKKVEVIHDIEDVY